VAGWAVAHSDCVTHWRAGYWHRVSTIVVTDSTAGIAAPVAEKAGLRVVSLTVTLGSRTSLEEDLDLNEFYRELALSGQRASTSQPSPAQFAEVFARAAAAGNDIVGVLISSRLSGTYQSAQSAAAEVRLRHPDAFIELVDSGSSAMELGVAALSAAKSAAEGAAPAAVAAAARAAKARSRILFVPQTLEYLRRGGRIGPAAALAGTALQIYPVLTVENGEAALAGRVRGRRHALDKLFERFESDVAARGFAEAFVQHADAAESAQQLADRVSALSGQDTPVWPLGATIGVHVGPGTVALAYSTVEVAAISDREPRAA
jgi:DegV family protein with EDD domain